MRNQYGTATTRHVMGAPAKPRAGVSIEPSCSWMNPSSATTFLRKAQSGDQPSASRLALKTCTRNSPRVRLLGTPALSQT
ncbi:MAG TPA: hypothetical protein VF669_20890 [Tepidisphaeraceae bacterium]|jgi:hypothetical protein